MILTKKPVKITIKVTIGHLNLTPKEGDVLDTPISIRLAPNVEYMALVDYEDGTNDGFGIEKSEEERVLNIIYDEETDYTYPKIEILKDEELEKVHSDILEDADE